MNQCVDLVTMYTFVITSSYCYNQFVTFSVELIQHRVAGDLKSIPEGLSARGSGHTGQGTDPSQATILHTITLIHTLIPITVMFVFGLEEKTGEPGGNP